MNCPDCSHCPTLREALRIWNPIRFPCPGCGVGLTFGLASWLFLLFACAVGWALASVAANQYNGGNWSFAESIVFLVFVLVVVLPGLEWLGLRFGTVKHWRKRAVQ